jgi:hypothetical protein
MLSAHPERRRASAEKAWLESQSGAGWLPSGREGSTRRLPGELADMRDTLTIKSLLETGAGVALGLDRQRQGLSAGLLSINKAGIGEVSLVHKEGVLEDYALSAPS